MADTDTTTQFLRSSMPLAETLGMTAHQADAEQVVLENLPVGKVIQTQSVLWPRA